MSLRFESMGTMAHHAMAHKLSGLVARQASDEAVDEFSSVTGSLGYSFGDITTLLPITRFASIDDVERIANDLESSAIAGPVHAHPEMFGIFYELGLNAVQHSQSVVGCYVISQLGANARGGNAHTIGVADCGMGIPNSLRMNPSHSHIIDDAEAIELATELHITGTGDAYRGIGLDHVKETVKSSGGHWIVVSGQGFVDFIAGSIITRGTVEVEGGLAGTIVVVTLPGL